MKFKIKNWTKTTSKNLKKIKIHNDCDKIRKKAVLR